MKPSSSITHLPLLALTAFSTVSAQVTTSLIIPGFDPQPLSADVIGENPTSGQTTWAVQAGPTGDFPGTATIVQGSDYASIFYIGSSPETTFTMAYGCTYQSGQSICTGTQNGQQIVETQTSKDTPIAVVVGTTNIIGTTSTGTSIVNPTLTRANSPSESTPSVLPTSGAVRLSFIRSGIIAGLTVGVAMSI